MKIIETNDYEGDYVCPICLEIFKEKDEIYLVKHYDEKNNKPEKIAQSRRKKHIFHGPCIVQYMEANEKLQNNLEECEHRCPLDRQKISKLVTVRYYLIGALNILNFSNNYYELIDKLSQKDIVYVSIIDLINLNYKDINGKTIVYCATQRGNLKLLKKLIKFGGNPTIPDDNGFTALMAAVTHNYLPIVKYLLKLPCIVNTINHQDDKGKTAIEYAFDSRRLQCVMEILKIKGLNNDILLDLLNQYQKIKPTDVNYIGCRATINTIKTKMRKYLGMPNAKKIAMKLNIPNVFQNKTEKFYCKINDRRENDAKVLDIDIVKNPELLDLIYSPINGQNTVICYRADELIGLSRYEQLNPDLIYQPFEQKQKKMTKVCQT